MIITKNNQEQTAMATLTAVWDCKNCHTKTKHHRDGFYADNTARYRCSQCRKLHGKLAPKHHYSISNNGVLPNKKPAPKPTNLEQKPMSTETQNGTQPTNTNPNIDNNNIHIPDFAKLFADLHQAGYSDEQIKSLINDYIKNDRWSGSESEEPTERPISPTADEQLQARIQVDTSKPSEQNPLPPAQPEPPKEQQADKQINPSSPSLNDDLDDHVPVNERLYHVTRWALLLSKIGIMLASGAFGIGLYQRLLPPKAQAVALFAVFALEGVATLLMLASEFVLYNQQKRYAEGICYAIYAVVGLNCVAEAIHNAHLPIPAELQYAINLYAVFTPITLGIIPALLSHLMSICSEREGKIQTRTVWGKRFSPKTRQA